MKNLIFLSRKPYDTRKRDLEQSLGGQMGSQSHKLMQNPPTLSLS